MDEKSRSQPPKGRIITFYSYKGGTGRSMAVANVSWMLALSGERVLIIDWDLEAPGIFRFFHPFLEDKELVQTEGLLDFVENLASRAAVAAEALAEEEVDVIEYVTRLEWPADSSITWEQFGPRAGIDLLVAGRQGPAYSTKLNAFNWIDFYQRLGGRRLLDIVRKQLRETYDYVFIDSRTGVSDTSGICTVEMPDTLVVCFTLNNQSMNGASSVAESVLEQRRNLEEKRKQSLQATPPTATDSAQQIPFKIYPIPMRVEMTAEELKRQAAIGAARDRFDRFIGHVPKGLLDQYWGKVQIAYFPYYAFEEIPAVFGDVPSQLFSLTTSVKQVTRWITGQSLEEPVLLDPDYVKSEAVREKILGWYTTVDKVAGLSRLPAVPKRFVGREDILKSLDTAWNREAPEQKVNVVSIVGWGGVGKSALVGHWLELMATEGYRAAKRVFCWSFAGQGVIEASAVGNFFSGAFQFFRVPIPHAAPPGEIGRLLAERIRRERTLLILDNLVALQSPPGDGQLRDRNVQVLLEELATDNPGLCVITTRQPVIELRGYPRTAQEVPLEGLSEEVGVELLRALGVRGRTEDLRAAVAEYDGNALALKLLGSYLWENYSGDISRRREPDLMTTERPEGKDARQMVEAYVSQFGEGPEVDVLRLLGLFQAEAKPAEVEILRRKPPIAGLTDKIVELSPAEWERTLDRLRHSDLLTPAPPDEPNTLDAHLLVRAYFTHQVREDLPDAWAKGHHRLFEYYLKAAPEKPTNEKDMGPLFVAMFHGCNAGDYARAFGKVLQPRILQSDSRTHSRFVSTNTLGLWSQTLEAIGLFFTDPWITVRDEFGDTDKAFLFTSAGTCLRALFRFREAAEAINRGLLLWLTKQEWGEAAFAWRMLNQTYIAAGQIKEAQECGRNSVDAALKEKETNLSRLATARARYAESLHHGGKITEAREQFEKALDKEGCLPDGFSEFEYCDLLITLDQNSQAKDRAERVIKVTEREHQQPLWRGLGHLVLGNLALIDGRLDSARTDFREAFKGLEKADEQQHLPLGHLARARLSCAQNRPKDAEEDLAKVLKVAKEPSGMLLHLTDYHLVSAECSIRWGKFPDAKDHIEQARGLIEKTGYYRRSEELKRLESSLLDKEKTGKR